MNVPPKITILYVCDILCFFRPVSDLASCITTHFGTYCEWNKIKVHLYSDKDIILQRLRMHYNTTEITTALERYDYSECEGTIMGKRPSCICENKGADQLHGNHSADQRLCFGYIYSTIPTS